MSQQTHRRPPHSSFFFNDTATTEIYTLSLHDALPIFRQEGRHRGPRQVGRGDAGREGDRHVRSEEHTSELQSRQYLVCRLLLEKKNSSARAGPTDECENFAWPDIKGDVVPRAELSVAL